MATQTNNFTRSNVNAATLQITDPGRSSFNLGHKNELSIPFGKIVPVTSKILIPSDTFSGSLKPNFHLEKIGTPSIGATRLDTHTFVVNFRRINNDMRKNLENGTNFFPSFDYYQMVDISFGMLFRDISGSLYSLVSNNLSAYDNFKSFSLSMLNKLVSALNNYYANYDKFSTPYYQKDKFLFLKDYYSSVIDYIDNLTNNPKDPLIFFQHFLPALLKPLCGPSSLLDYLGYPIYTQYNRMVSSTLSLTDTSEAALTSFYSEFKAKLTPNLFKSIIMNTATFFRSPDASGDKFKFVSEPSNTLFSEMPLRAYYAAWYDYIRNWHIEERTHILDPDQFNNNLVFNFPSFVNDYSKDLPNVAKFLSFYTLKSRDYGTDFLTSIQTDDSFRHVYSPVMNRPNSEDAYKISVNTDLELLTPHSLNGIYIEGAPSGSLFYFPSDGDSSTTKSLNQSYVQDLQTMRRAGMLERWLARNYYYPDTYVGRLQARFGVRPSDYEVLVSQYIGGSESFISGQELVANMSTSETVVGSRSLKADVSTRDNFSGSVSDYSILISVVSTVPIVTYDVINPAARITDFVDYPQPEFATDTRVEARISDLLRGFSIKPYIGYVPRYYQFRVSADETHGRYLTDYRVYNWLRDNYSMAQEAFEFSLNPYSLRVNLPLNAFIGLKPWDDFAYGSCDVNLVVNRALPAAIEII